MRTQIVRYGCSAFVLWMALSCGTLLAQAPPIISYQGLLTDASGQAKPDGAYQLKLRLYDSATGGTALWRDDNLSVQVVRGVFSTMIGGPGKQPLPPFDRPYWLGVEVGSEGELSPRTQLASVPYSLHAVHADTATTVVGGIPVGTLMAFAGAADKVPPGWMICDGHAVNSQQFPALFNAIGAAWGDGSDDEDNTTDFNLPDLRGMFLRGVDTGATVDQDAATRFALKSGGATGAAVGSYQNDASTGLVADDPFTFDQSSSLESRLGPNTRDASTQTFTSGSAVESRPKNANVHYIIKVR